MWKGSDIGSDEMFGVLGLEEPVLSSTGRMSGSRVLANFFSSYLIVLSYWLALQSCDVWSLIGRPTCNPIAAFSSDSVNLTSCHIGREAGPMAQAALPFVYLDAIYVIEPRQTPLHTTRMCMWIQLNSISVISSMHIYFAEARQIILIKSHHKTSIPPIASPPRQSW